MHLFYTPDFEINQRVYTLNEDESKHCVRVLRLTVNDKIELINGKGLKAVAQVVDDNPKRCEVKIVEVIEKFEPRKTYLHIAIAPTKNIERTEWFIEKATEIGISEVSFIKSKNSERDNIKTERIEKVAISAIKQSLKAYLPQLNDLVDFKKAIQLAKDFKGEKYIAHCNSGVKEHLKNVYTKNTDVLIMIGPEGDFTLDEVKYALENGFQEISLGSSRLRTETAALYACAAINIINE